MRHPILGYVKLHTGQDYSGSNPSVRAVARGVVAFAGTLPEYGITVIIAHESGFETVYAHLARAEVRPGLCVDVGKEVGIEGSTGLSTGPHLHFEIRHNGRPVDPAPFF
jgi:murein DD-endopeptidase MepM/ murein hydrolase activator NlpD